MCDEERLHLREEGDRYYGSQEEPIVVVNSH
jgi:hypothetical protein